MADKMFRTPNLKDQKNVTPCTTQRHQQDRTVCGQCNVIKGDSKTV